VDGDRPAVGRCDLDSLGGSAIVRPAIYRGTY
jgi:hypothetical protein